MHAYTPRLLSVQSSENRIDVRFNVRSLTEQNTPAVGDELTEVATCAGPAELRLDFTGVDYFGSLVLAKLVGLHKRMAQAGGRLLVVNLEPHLFELFQVTRLATLLSVRPKETPAAV